MSCPLGVLGLKDVRAALSMLVTGAPARAASVAGACDRRRDRWGTLTTWVEPSWRRKCAGPDRSQRRRAYCEDRAANACRQRCYGEAPGGAIPAAFKKNGWRSRRLSGDIHRPEP